MAVSESTLTVEQVPAEDVQQAEEFLTDFLAAEYPDLDLTQGKVLRDILIRPAAIFHALNRTDYDRLRQSMSLLAISENPDLADPDIVDGVLSNLMLTRDPGAKAAGQLTIILSVLATTTVPAGSVFTANGLNYLTDQTYIGVTQADSVLNDQQKLITLRSDGTYSFTIPVTAESEGTQYAVRRGTRFTVVPSIIGLVDITAAVDFSGGRNVETNADLVARAQLGISAKILSGRTEIEAMLREAFPDIVAVSITGFSDPEMIRDRHNIFAMSMGGKADLYVRSSYLPVIQVFEREAVLINASEKIWQMSVGRDVFPGFYSVQFVLPQGASQDQNSLEISGETRALDLSAINGDFIPDILNIVEGGYSRYQTAVIQFKDPATDTTGMVENETVRTYQVGLYGLNSIADLQHMVSDRARRNPQADYLVKAPVPAFCAVNLTVQYRANSQPPVAADLKQSIAATINKIGYDVGRIPASRIYDAVHNVAGQEDVLVVSPIDMFCQIRRPDGTILTLRSPNAIEVPSEPDRGVTSRTVAFFTDPTMIDVAVEKINVLPV